MIKCGKSFMPECKYFTTGGCVSPFNCPYKIEKESITTATSTPLNPNVIYTTESDKDAEIERLTKERNNWKHRAETAETVISDLRTKLAKAEHDRKRYKAKIEELRKVKYTTPTYPNLPSCATTASSKGGSDNISLR